jgi:hypothetical protein
VAFDVRFFRDDLFDVAQEPLVEMGDRVDVLDREALAEGLRRDQQAVGRGAREGGGDFVTAGADQHRRG